MNTKEQIEELFNRGIENFRKENIYESILIFKEILAENPHNSKANYYLANCYALMDGAADFAIPYFEKAIEIEDDKYEYYLDMAATLKYLGKFEKSLQILEKAKDKFEGLGNAYIMMASIYLSMGKEKKARNFSRMGNEYPRYRFDSHKKEWISVEPAGKITEVEKDISVINKPVNTSKENSMILPEGIEYLQLDDYGNLYRCIQEVEFKNISFNKKTKKYIIEFDREYCSKCNNKVKCISSKMDSRNTIKIKDIIIKKIKK